MLHTLNLRLHPDEIAFIANHAGDRFLIVDDVLLPVYEKFRDRVKFERVIVVPFGGGETPAGCDGYEELLAGASEDFTYPQLDENEAAAMCYTSGTTGRSKGVVYSHRALVLHSLDCCGVNSFAISARDTVLQVASLFHANGWGIPFTAALAGAKVVLPGPFADAEGILDLMEQEHVTASLGVPTIFFGVLDALDKYPGRWKFDWPVRLLVGGAASSEALMRGFDRHGITLICLFGMTETTPHATCSHLRPHMDSWSEEKKYAQRLKQGIPASIVEARIMRPDGTPAPHDGATVGEIELRGPWIASAYYNLAGRIVEVVARRLAAHRRHGPHRRRRLPQAGRPQQGLDQVRRRVDQFARPGERADGAPRRERSRRHRRAASEMAGAPAGRGRAE